MDWLDWLTARQFGIARILRLVVAVGLGLYLSYGVGYGWHIWFPAGLVALLIVPVLWGVFLGILERRRLRRELL